MDPQIGGRLLGQGVYGCTFDPAPRCANGSVFKQITGLPAVGKITSEDSADELAVGQAIMALPLAPLYFALPTKVCKPALPVQDPDASTCNVLKESQEMSMLVMPLAGQPLLKYGMNHSRLAETYKKIFIHLLEGGVIYQRAGYVHNDIHMANVLVDDKSVARYIDFGLAFKVSDVKTWDDANLGTDFKPQYIFQAPEVHAVRMVKNGIRVIDGVQQLYSQNPEYRQMEHRFPTRKRCDDSLTSLIASFKGSSAEFVRTYGSQFDAWRIGLCMWFMWDDLLQSLAFDFKKSDLYKEADLIRKVMGGLTDFDPRTRLTMAGALKVLDPNNRLA
jgi:serine/threonine protein kinase